MIEDGNRRYEVTNVKTVDSSPTNVVISTVAIAGIGEYDGILVAKNQVVSTPPSTVVTGTVISIKEAADIAGPPPVVEPDVEDLVAEGSAVEAVVVSQS